MVSYDFKGQIERAQKDISRRLTYRDLTADVRFLDAYMFNLYNALQDRLDIKQVDPSLIHKVMGGVLQDRPFVQSICELIAANEHKAEHLKETDSRVKYNAIMGNNALLNSIILCTLAKYANEIEKASYNQGVGVADINYLINLDISKEKKDAIAELLMKWLDLDGYRQRDLRPQGQRCPVDIQAIK